MVWLAVAIECGKNDVGFWFNVQENHSIPPFKVAYEEERMSLLRRGCEFVGYAKPIALATRSLQFSGVNVDLKSLFKGYILTDLDENPESANVAVTASHVYNAIIVDKRDKICLIRPDIRWYMMRHKRTFVTRGTNSKISALMTVWSLCQIIHGSCVILRL